MPLHIFKGDITECTADILVVPANKEPVYGKRLDKLVYERAGAEAILAEREEIGELHTAQVAITSAGALKAKYLLHVNTPEWHGGAEWGRAKLAECYRNALLKAVELDCKSIAFPLLSAGSNHFPKEEARRIALYEIGEFLAEHDLQVQMVYFGLSMQERLDLVYKLMPKTYDYSSTEPSMVAESTKYGGFSWNYNPDLFAPHLMTQFQIDTVLGKRPSKLSVKQSRSFEEIFMELKEQKGITESNSKIYTAAMVKKSTFSKLLNEEQRKDLSALRSRNCVYALAVEMRLTEEETELLLNALGQTMQSPLPGKNDEERELIIHRYISLRLGNVFDLNDLLELQGKELIGDAYEDKKQRDSEAENDMKEGKSSGRVR